MNDLLNSPTLNCLVVLLIFAALAFEFRPRGNENAVRRYEKPQVRSARMSCDRSGYHVLEMDVTSTHHQYVSDGMQLPSGSSITTVERNRRYRVEIPVGLNLLSKLPLEEKALVEAQEWAKANGYKGRVS